MINIALDSIPSNAGIKLIRASGYGPQLTIAYEQDGVVQPFGLLFDFPSQTFIDELDTPWRTRAIRDLIPALVEIIKAHYLEAGY